MSFSKINAFLYSVPMTERHGWHNHLKCSSMFPVWMRRRRRSYACNKIIQVAIRLFIQFKY